ncbi:MAG TPA: APC family permease [Vicinamibacterales bacterium]|nr:APC family permease [Vicinamibacterales bacterium]
MTDTRAAEPLDRVAEIEARSAAFRRELGLATLALTQIMYVVGSGWVGTAAKLGPSHVIFWSAAILLYYLPQAAVVIYLNRLMPLEGGLYQWATEGLGKFLGFLTAWNLWAYSIAVMAVFGVVIATNLAYLLTPMGVTFTKAAWYTPVVSSTAVVVLSFVSLLGLRVGKWLQGIGGWSQILMFSALIVVPYVAISRGTAHAYHPLAWAMPSFTLLSVNIFGKMALGALSGFEYVAILAGECRAPSRSIGQSVLIATPVIAIMFIFGTSSVLALVPQDQIDLVSPIPQALQIGFKGLGVAQFIVPALIVMLLARQIGNVTLIFAGNTRLPMVAGWDRLVPAWFTRLHPRYRTPYNSILFVGALTLVLTLLGQVGVGLQEAYQLIENAAGIFYAFTYLALFAIPLFGAARLGVTPPLWLRVMSASGFAVSLLYSVLSVFPIIDVASWQVFAVKIISVLVIANVIGVAIYRAGVRRAAGGAME